MALLCRKSSSSTFQLKLLGKTETLTRKKQLKDWLRRWRLQKNINRDIMKQIAWTRSMRKREGKRSKFLFSRRPVPEEKINAYLKGSKISDEDLLSMPCPVEGILFLILYHRKY
jgi:hypothetical protein